MESIREFFYKKRAKVRDEKGQSLVEYALILVLIAVVCIVMLTGVGGSTCRAFSAVNSSLRATGS
jgi:Flp pilus assembly pilin Flp